jgi:hypothetical protein
MIPTDMKEEKHGRKTFQWRQIASSNIPIQPDASTFQAFISHLHAWEQRLLRIFEFLHPIEDIIDIFNNETKEVYIVSDGGCSANLGSFGWIISNQSMHLVQGQGVVPGGPMSSHRAEGFGKLAWITFLKRFIEYFHCNPKCIIMSFCDNKAIVTSTKFKNMYHSSRHSLCPNYDVLRAIALSQTDLSKSCKSIEETKHVKAQQDATKSDDKLSTEERLNIKADALATETLRQLISADEIHEEWHLPHCFAYLRSGPSILSSAEIYTSRWKFSEFNIQTYYGNKFDLSIQELHRINWAALRLARAGLTPGQQTFSIKHAIGWTATGKQLKLQGNIISTFHICQDEEDSDHYCLPIPASLNSTFSHQSLIGWHLATRGFLSTDWAVQQDRYAEINNSIIIGDIWCAKICKWWIQATHEIWLERNSSVHNTTEDGSNRQAKEICAQVTLLYEKENNLQPKTK